MRAGCEPTASVETSPSSIPGKASQIGSTTRTGEGGGYDAAIAQHTVMPEARVAKLEVVPHPMSP